MKPIVFVSHIHDEAPIAIWLKQSISRLLLGGIDIFVSSDRCAISGGDRWLDKIEGALRDAPVVLVLCSAQSVGSPWVNFEAGGAWIAGKRIVPLCYGGMDPSGLPEPLRSLQAYKLDQSQDFHDLVSLLAREAGLNEPEFDATTLLNSFPAQATDALQQNGVISESVATTPARGDLPGLLPSAKQAEAPNIISWDEWWKRLLQLVKLLREPYKDGRFIPDAVFGISGGGLMIAEILGQEVYKGVPVFPLWADRWRINHYIIDPKCHYFDNVINKSLIHTFKQRYHYIEQMKILLVEDVVYTAVTIQQAEIFLKREIGEECNIMLIPLCLREVDYFDKIEHMLPYQFNNGRSINITKNEFFELTHTLKDRFEYKKIICY
jgi:hypoxanthine phosphoribosyltransferase